MKNRIIPVVLILIFVVLGCNLPGTSTSTETSVPETETAIAEPVQSSPTMESHSPTLEPTTTEPVMVEPTATEPAQPENTTPFTCRGVSLALPNDLASGITCEVIPTANEEFWEVYPEYDQLNIDGYLLQNTFHQPEIAVYPIAEYQAMSPQAATIISNLSQLLNNPSENPESIPFLPLFNAAQMIRTKISYINFQNGAGVRFLTQYGQAAYPVNNYSLFYSYQGITSDGQYYVSVILPVNHADLLATGDDPSIGDWAAFSENFGIYVADMTLQMDAYTDDSFFPSLTTLDNLVESIRVE